MTSSACLPLPSLFVRYAHLTVTISLSEIVPRAMTAMAQTRAFAIIGPSLWNQLLPSRRPTLLAGEPSASFRSLKTASALLSESLALEALLIYVHCNKRYINV